MPKRATPLTAQKVARAKPGRHYDGDGLHLFVKESNTVGPTGKIEKYGLAYWVFRYVLNGKPARDMGLGRAFGHNSVSLAKAREAAVAPRELVKRKIDPLTSREAEQAQRTADEASAAAGRKTFEAAANEYIADHEPSWRNPKHRQQWRNTLRDYVFPAIGSLPVAAVGTGEIIDIIKPLWLEKSETASRLRGRIETVLDYATTHKWRIGDNPARWRGHLEHILPKRSKVSRVEHHAALPWKHMGDFMPRLRAQAGRSALAVEFAILTAARSSEVRGARWHEIDMIAAEWVVPAARMKADREHRVPLSSRAVEILKELEDLRASPADLVFPGGRHGGELSDVALSKAAKYAAGTPITVHGFRSSFRDWCAESTNYPRELAEKALAHTLSDKVEAAYQRGDMIEKRRRLMEEWAKFCSKPKRTGDNVTALRTA